MEKLRTMDSKKVKENQTGRKRLSMNKTRAKDNKKVKHDQNMRQKNHRNIENARDRLKDFKEETKYNAIFICTCCHQRMFKSNVQLFNEEMRAKIKLTAPGIIHQCIAEPEVKTMVD